MRNYFEKKGEDQMRDILRKVRRAREKDGKPNWTGEDARKRLIALWDSDEYKKKCEQAKANRASAKGGAVHTSGRRAHSEARELGQSIDPDELFMATHTKKSRGWVDKRAATTYDRERQKEVASQLEDVASSDGDCSTTEVDGNKKFQVWNEVVRGNIRGRTYGTGDLVSQVHPGVTSLTNDSYSPTISSWDASELIAENQRLRQQIEIAIKQVAEANAKFDKIEAMYQELTERLARLEQNLGMASTSAQQQQMPHPNYDEDDKEQSLDEHLPDRRLRRRRRHD